MTPTLKCGMWFALAGFGIAILLTGLAYYQNTHGLHYGLDGLYLILFPPPLGLVATESASLVGQIVIVMLLSMENAVLYGLIGLGVGRLWARLNERPSGI